MTLHTKRSMLRLSGLATVAAAAALVGCGKKEEAAPAAASAPASAAAPAKAEPLKVAFAYVGPVGDGDAGLGSSEAAGDSPVCSVVRSGRSLRRSDSSGSDASSLSRR